MRKTIILSLLVLSLFSIFFVQYAYAQTVIYNVARNTGYLIGDNNGVNGFNEVVGERATTTSDLGGEQFNRITVTLNRCAGCTANDTIYIGVWDFDLVPSSANMLASFGTIANDVLSETPTQHTFTSNVYTIPSSGDIVIGVGRFTGTTQAGSVGANTGNVFNGTSSYLVRYETSWNTNTAQDFAMKLELVSATTTGLDCSLPENANILICRLGGDGTLGSAGAFVIGDIENGTGVLGIGCSLGLVDCSTDSNPQTNGLGLLIFIASIFVIVGMFFATIGAGNTFHMPIFIWVVIIIALSAFFTITGLIDPVFLILSIIAIIALGAPKVISAVRGSTFGGGSTE